MDKPTHVKITVSILKIIIVRKSPRTALNFFLPTKWQALNRNLEVLLLDTEALIRTQHEYRYKAHYTLANRGKKNSQLREQDGAEKANSQISAPQGFSLRTLKMASKKVQSEVRLIADFYSSQPNQRQFKKQN